MTLPLKDIGSIFLFSLGKRHISILSTRTSYGRFSGNRPHPSPLETSPAFFGSAEARQLEQGQDLIMSIQIHLKYKYTYKNAGFCMLCVDNFNILKIFSPRNVTGANPPPPAPQCPYDVSRGQNRYVTLPLRNRTRKLYHKFFYNFSE